MKQLVRERGIGASSGTPGDAEAPAWWPAPPLGDGGVAPGNLWPPATGREALRRLTGATPRARLDLVAQHGDRDGSGTASTVVYDAGGWCIRTSSSRRFDDLDAARVALVQLARTRIALGALTQPGTVLVTCGEPAGGYWVWTLAPWRRTLRGAMIDAVAAGDRAGLGDALVGFAGAVGEALVRAVRTGQGLDLHPGSFALDGEAVVYVDDGVVEAPPLRGAAHAILERAEELAGYPAEIDRYARALIDEIAMRLGPDGIARLGLVEDLRTAAPRSPLARALRARLLAALDPAPAPDLAAPGAAVEAWPLPPTAAEHLPSGFIWPVVAGRELVRQILTRTATRRGGRPFTYDLGDYTLSTSSERRFIEVDDAHAELLRLARAQVTRGAAQPRVVLVLAPDDTRGGHWIWTLAPSAGAACVAP